MEDEEMEKKVQQYLQRKGFRLTELALQEERNRLSATSLSDVALSRSGNDPARYYDGYSKLRTWAYSSLDQYKHELLRVLYPVFIHCFMDLVAEGHTQEARSFFHKFREDHELMHSRDLQKLEGILSPSHLEEMELARSLRLNKFRIKLCEYSYELLLQYLQKTQVIVMLGIINERITFEVSPGQPSLISDDADVVALVGTSKELAKQINQKEVHWGLLEDSVEERMEKALLDSDKTEAESKDADAEDNKKKSSEGGMQPLSSASAVAPPPTACFPDGCASTSRLFFHAAPAPPPPPPPPTFAPFRSAAILPRCPRTTSSTTASYLRPCIRRFLAFRSTARHHLPPPYLTRHLGCCRPT